MKVPVYRPKERVSAFNAENVTVYFDRIYEKAKYEVKTYEEVKRILDANKIADQPFWDERKK